MINSKLFLIIFILRTNVLQYNIYIHRIGSDIMDEKLLRFFKLIGFNDIIAFEEASLKDMVINRKEHTWLLRINAKNIINVYSNVLRKLRQ